MLNICVVNIDIFDIMYLKSSDNISMEVKGLTIQEIANALGIPYKTAHKRLETAGIKPLVKEAIYPESALEAIRNVPNRGRPPKAKAAPDKNEENLT